MKKVINTLVKPYLKLRYQRIQKDLEQMDLLQKKLLQQLVNRGKHTKWGKMHDYKNIKSYGDFVQRVPLQDYQSMRPYIERVMRGEENVLWPGKVNWFAKSSGTTSTKSKYIPVTKENFKNCHSKCFWDQTAIIYNLVPDAQIFAQKSLLMGGSLSTYDHNEKALIGDISAILLNHMPAIGRPFYSPDFKTALMGDWEEKIEKMAQQCQDEPITMMGGVPSWSMVLFDRLLELTGKENMEEVWPELKFFVHGGVSFAPYKEQFKRYFPSNNLRYLEIYNASEGFLGYKMKPEDDVLTLIPSNGMFYEFQKFVDGVRVGPVIPLWEVETGVNYAIIISTNSGLWRYEIGDLVRFEAKQPYRFSIMGRTKAYINTFGEELMVGDTDLALKKVTEKLDLLFNDYTVCPRYLEAGKQGAHEWIIECPSQFYQPEAVINALDEELCKINSDYEAKRSYDMILTKPIVHFVPEGTFYNWMKARKKLGGQFKVPRLSNDRAIVESILSMKSNA